MRKGQTTFETCVFIIVLIAGTLAMNDYFRRALQHNWRANADNFSNEQYDGKDCFNSRVDTIIKSPKLLVKIGGKEIYSEDLASGSGSNINLTEMGTYQTEEKNEEDVW